jgi:hypothetical protein
MGYKIKLMNSLKLAKNHMFCLMALFEDETLIITKNDIIEFKDKLIMY